MNLVWAIARRELRGVLHTPVGWLVIMAFLMVSGVFWMAMVDNYVVAAQGQVYSPLGGPKLRLTDHLLVPWFGNLVVLLLLVVPAISMRAFAEELRQHTLELLRTSPVTTAQVVAGKYLGGLGLASLMLLATVSQPLLLWWWAPFDPGVLFAGFLALWLVAAAVLAIGLLASSFTDSPLVALILTFAVVITLWISGWVDPDPTSLPSQLSMSTHVADLTRGALHLSDLSYFTLLIGWCLFATHQRVEAYRYV